MAANFLSGYLALGSGSGTTFVELSGSGYARQAITFAPLVNGVTASAAGMTFAATGQAAALNYNASTGAYTVNAAANPAKLGDTVLLYLTGEGDYATSVSPRTGLDGALLGTGIPFRSHQNEKLPGYIKALEELAPQTAGIRRAGSAALDLAYVAAGRFDAFWEMGLKPWDIAAGLLLIQEAGGLVSDFEGGNHYMESGNVVCGNPKCFKHVLQVVNQHLG